MTRLEAGIEEATARMEFAEFQWCQIAKREGWKVVGRGKCYSTGPELVQLEVPQKYAGQIASSMVFSALYDRA